MKSRLCNLKSTGLQWWEVAAAAVPAASSHSTKSILCGGGQTLSYGKMMLNGIQDTVCRDGRDDSKSAPLQCCYKCCLIYSGQCASEQFIKKEKIKPTQKTN